MKLIRGLHNIQKVPNSVITIGNFDGIHLGHQALIKQTVQEAKRKNFISIVISFQKTAQQFFGNQPAVLTNFREKYQLLKNLGVDYFLIINFNEKFANLSAFDFVQEVLLNQFKMHKIIIGDDFKFGKNRQGDFLYLQKLSQEKNFIVQASHSILQENIRVSSSKIRQTLAHGDLVTAQKCLGRQYSISGKVVVGKKLGRTLGFPTLNIALKDRKSPLMGIFIVQVKLQNKLYNGVASIGINPTVESKNPILEVFLFDFNKQVYQQFVEVFFIKKIRDEKKFNNLEALKKAITKDCKIARRYFKNVFIEKYLLKYKIIFAQILLTFLVGLFYSIKSPDIILGFSAVMGSSIVIVNTILFLWSTSIAKNIADAKQGIVVAYLFAGFRFVLVGVLLVVGISFGLKVLPMIVGFVIVQLGQFVNLFKFK